MSQETEVLQEAESLFNREYEQELATWARRRFRNFCIAFLLFLMLGWMVMALSLTSLMVVPLPEAESAESMNLMSAMMQREVLIGTLIAGIIELIILLGFFIRNRRSVDSSQQLIKSATKMVMILSVIDVLVVGLLA